MKKSNNYLRFGMLLICAYFIFNQFAILPDFLMGACLSLGILLEALGLYSIKYDVSKLKLFKKNF
ncbi:MAG: hypothetical protein RR486_04280 [Clostridium sp.]|uniref:hypothetical protein n=1 Tax=Clostridium sp. TaxID=1506 RepID=UPI003036731A